LKQAILKKGIVTIQEVPKPTVTEGTILIKVVNSCISTGTEISSVEKSGDSIIDRIISQPEIIRKGFNSLQSEGIKGTLSKVKEQTAKGKHIGYSISGVVVSCGTGVENFSVGDRVAGGGAGYAHHAEYVKIPTNLAVTIPLDVNFKQASTVTLGAIAMQGVRRADMRLGENCVVMGAGLIGLLTIQILVASGIRVATVDLVNYRLKIAQEKYGVEAIINPSEADALNMIDNWTGGYGADCVIITAASSSSQLLSDAFQMCRKKGKVVLVGNDLGMNLKLFKNYTFCNSFRAICERDIFPKCFKLVT